MKWYPFSEVITDATSKFSKIKASEYQAQGKYKIIDQGKAPIAGYTDDTNLVNGQLLPILIFGDHTRALKYENDPIALGADGAKALWVNPDLAHTRYIYYYLRSIQLKEAGYSRHFKFLKQIEIPIPFENNAPDFNNQIRIVHLLGKVEGLIAVRKRNLKELDDLLKSLFLEFFGDPVRNEKGWEPTIIGQLIKVASGNGLVAKDMNTQGPHKVYGGNGVNGVHSEYMFDAPTLVIGRVGYYCGSVHITEPKSWVTDNALYVKKFLKRTDLVFLKHLLAAHDLNKIAGRAAQPLVSGSRIYPIPTIDVPFEKQQAFSAIVEKVEELRSRYQQSFIDLEALFNTLSQQAFKGTLDLSRVPLPGIEPEEEKAMPVELLHNPSAEGFAIHLPDTENLLETLENADARAALITQWLEAYRGQLGNTPFSIQHFMTAAQTRLVERQLDNDFELGTNEFEHIKTWVFEALAAGKLVQAFDDANNRIELKAVQV
ncbi:restriction endonuclease subunit S [Pseudomonas sp. Ps21-P2]|uniref:restriction endonuclease subunit S n=1 Tax=Pseudomonas sp. Ps21-P2 TaxID=3080331 RepID=UPI00320960BE